MPAQAEPGSAAPTDRDGTSLEIVVAGAHGGAGTTTLAILLQPAWDMGAVRLPATGGPLRTGGRPLVIVAGCTVTRSARAAATLNALSSHGGRVAVLVIVSDGLPEPAAAAYRFQILAARVGAVVRVPFIAALRAADDPARVDLPRKARSSIADIRAAAFTRAAGPSPVTTQ
jgi:hypothetical protein